MYNKDRCELIALFVIENDSTVRRAAKKFCVSKSTVHKDITFKLKKINHSLYKAVKDVMDKNKLERHIRGGEATKRKYLIKRAEKSSLPDI